MVDRPAPGESEGQSKSRRLPRTLADALAMLNRLACKESGLPCGLIPGEEMSVAVVLLREFLATLVSRR